MSDLRPLLDQVISLWREGNIPIRPGVDAKSIASFESRHAVKLPHDLREYFCTVDGTGDEFDDEWLYRFWPLKDIKSTSEYGPELTTAFPESLGYFFFFDHSIELFLYAIRLTDSASSPTPIAHIFPQLDGLSFDPFCDSFTEFLSIYVNDPGDLL